ncbi:hypothetical protein ACLH0K_05000 [Arthrobacter sp. MPF02]|uniref:hypothetical protein n=1 Tax=Arthrobacter sp. MPF02 TaxID=3388492 RepID=UPI003984C340
MSETTSTPRDQPTWFEIRVQGHLAPRWQAWFGAEQFEAHDDGTTVLRGQVTDQAQLFGMLQKVRDTGLPLVSVARLDQPVPLPEDVR